MSTLYKLSARYEALLNKDELNEEELIELEQIHDDTEDKAIAYAYRLKNLQAESKMITDAIADMDERLSKILDTYTYWQNQLLIYMQKCKLEKITKSPHFKIIMKLNPIKVNDYDKNIIPDKFWSFKEVVTKSVNKTAIRVAIEAGEEVPGANLVRDHKLEIK